MATCAHGASLRRLCFLRGGAKHTKSSQRGRILAARLFGISAGDQGALLQQAVPCLSLLTGFSGSEITLKGETHRWLCLSTEGSLGGALISW